MSSYVAFTKKEFLEAYRTWKLLLFCIISVIIGMMNPLFAKLTPEILIGNGEQLPLKVMR